MRAVFYGVINLNTMSKVSVGLDSKKAEAKLIELQNANPNDKFEIVRKWGNI